MVLIDDPSAPSPDVEAVFRAMFDLTVAEAEIAVRLSHGDTPEEIAEIRDVHLSTIRTQVRSLLAKTGRRRLTEAVMDLARVAAMMPSR